MILIALGFPIEGPLALDWLNYFINWLNKPIEISEWPETDYSYKLPWDINPPEDKEENKDTDRKLFYLWCLSHSVLLYQIIKSFF